MGVLAAALALLWLLSGGAGSGYPIQNAASAVLDPRKFTEYLLESRWGHGKDRLWAAVGYTQDNWQELRAALLDGLQDGDAWQTGITTHGVMYNARYTIPRGDGRGDVEVLSAWIFRNQEDFPRLVTSYPV